MPKRPKAADACRACSASKATISKIVHDFARRARIADGHSGDLSANGEHLSGRLAVMAAIVEHPEGAGLALKGGADHVFSAATASGGHETREAFGIVGKVKHGYLSEKLSDYNIILCGRTRRSL